MLRADAADSPGEQWVYFVKMDSTKEKCIIHIETYDNDPTTLVTPKDYDSWLVLLDAARVRNHKPILQIAESLHEQEMPNICYHRQCRSRFTLKRDLNNFKRKSAENSEDDPGSSGAAKRHKRTPSTSRVYQPECIFCGKDKCLKGTSTREHLTLARQLRVDERLRQCAREKQDDKILAATSRDIVAAEAHYHKSCYKNYTRKTKKSQESRTSKNENEYEKAYNEVESEAYDDLFTFIRNEMLPDKLIVPVATLAARMENFMHSRGYRMNESTKKHIKRRLDSEVGDIFHIYKDEAGKLLAIPDSITMQDMVLENKNLRNELKTLRSKSSDIKCIIHQASSYVRTSIQESCMQSPWPYHPSDLKNESMNLPCLLQQLLTGILTGEPEKENPSQRVKLLIQSLGQDLIYATTRGKQKPPKHLLLPYAVKTLTGNTELIRMLNRLGHGISYSQLEENDTALCLQKLAATQNQTVVLPTPLQPYIFTNLAWDNIDRLEETLTGQGTSHRVNGIAVQRKIIGPLLPKPALPVIDKQKQRTISTQHTELETYIAGRRVGPQPLPPRTSNKDTDEAAESARNNNLIWIILRQSNIENKSIPSWTGFNINMRKDISIKEDILCYLPTINAPATELTTAFEILNQSEAIRTELQLPVIVIVVDQAIFAKISEIAWRHRVKYANVIIRLGAFHTICNALAVLGKRFMDAGLRDLCIESGVVSEGSVKGVLEGKMYNRAVRVHKLVYEALMRLIWEQFMSQLDEDEHVYLRVQNTLSQLTNKDLNQNVIGNLLVTQDFKDLKIMWSQFLNHLRKSNGDLSAFWMSYVDMVEDIILGLLRASREGNWELHLHAIRSLIPWSFAYDRTNYARYLPVYYAQMSALSETHPEVYEAFRDGCFSVQMSSTNPFGRLPVDQALEVTVNRDTQTPGGTTRFSLKSGAVKRYYITSEHRSAFLGQLRDMVHENKSDAVHYDLQHPRSEKDEEAVLGIVSAIESWVNPFSSQQDMMSISTAKTATPEVASDLLNALDVGEKCYTKFKQERLDFDPPVTQFFDTVKLNKLKTFSHMCRKKEVKTQTGRAVILKADRSLFGRIIVMAQSRNLQMADILSYPLGPMPWALATPEGLPRKTNKAILAKALYKDVTPEEEMPLNSASVIDGMMLVQKVKGDQNTFGDIAQTVFAMVMKEGGSSQRIDIVFDQYHELSIKNSERSVRGEQHGSSLQNVTPNQLVRQWRSFLNQSVNKTNFITFLVNEWKQQHYRSRLQQKVMFVTDADQCFKITQHGSEMVTDLSCTQEEADGRLLLHAAHAVKQGHPTVVISSDDTDVLILLVAFKNIICGHLYLKCGIKTRTKILSIDKVTATLGADICKGLVGMHAFTGCDSVSAFAGKGKTSSLKLMTTNKDVLDAFMELGSEWDLSQEQMERLEAVTCLIYAAKTPCVHVNALRYNLFCARKGEIESHQLPPSRDCLKQHAQRANYQSAIWRRCLQQNPHIPNPVGHGWKLEKEDGGDQLVIKWMDGQPVPEAVLDLLSCKCSKKCAIPRCVCLANGLKCTDMCKLQDCENRVSGGEDDDNNDETMLEMEDFEEY